MATNWDTATPTGEPGMMDETKHKAHEAVSDLQRKAGEQLRTTVDSGRTRAAEALGGFAQALTDSSQQMRDKNLALPSQYAERAGEQIRRASDYLRDTNVDDLARNAQSFARREPALFLGGIFALGMIAARFVKASQNRETGRSSSTALTSHSPWMTDRETSVSGFREPSAGMGSDWGSSTATGLSDNPGRSVL